MDIGRISGHGFLVLWGLMTGTDILGQGTIWVTVIKTVWAVYVVARRHDNLLGHIGPFTLTAP